MLFKAHNVDDFGGISISPVISKVFKHCILARFNRYFAAKKLIVTIKQFSYKHRLGRATVLHTYN